MNHSPKTTKVSVSLPLSFLYFVQAEFVESGTHSLCSVTSSLPIQWER